MGELIKKSTEAQNESLARKIKLIHTASICAVFGNAALAILKIIVGIAAGSLAVIGDGIDSSVDVVISLITFLVARVISRPADKEHPWGHGRAETLATAVLGCLLFFAGAQLIINSAGSLIRGDSLRVPGPVAIIVTLVSVAGKLILAWSQFYFGKKAGSSMLKANAKNMLSDVILSAGVLVGLGLSIWLDLESADAIMAILVSLWVIKSAVGILLEVNVELMDGAPETGAYQAVFDAIHSVEGVENPHRARMRRIAGLWDIDLDIEVRPNLTVLEAHWIAHRVETAIKEKLEAVYDIVVHIEPAGNVENEGFGLSENPKKEADEA